MDLTDNASNAIQGWELLGDDLLLVILELAERAQSWRFNASNGTLIALHLAERGLLCRTHQGFAVAEMDFEDFFAEVCTALTRNWTAD